MRGAGSRRIRLLARRAVAFCPGAITNFFRIQYDRHGGPSGATGGGYVLSKGTRSWATFEPGATSSVSTVVNGDPEYDARTTRRALALLWADNPDPVGRLVVRQRVETPIGSGFGASAASAVSGAYAAAAALGFGAPKRALALPAHRAEIIERTGLGTVSVVYDGIGAGAITTPGEPGLARFRRVRIPRDLRIVTAYLAPYDKRDALSSRSISGRVNRLGAEALDSFLRDPTLETLSHEGERFSRNLGLESPEVRKLVSAAKSGGAMSASQNMIGYAVHALVDVDRIRKVGDGFKGVASGARVDVFRVGDRRAGLLS